MLPFLIPLDLGQDFMNMMSAMMQPLYWAVSGIVVFFHWLFSMFMDPNSGWTWTLAIISLTVVIRTALIPLFVKQIKSSRNMQLLQPKVRALTDKYGHDRERLGQEQMKLYKEEGVNPMASCLPLLLQMPIFLALFRVLDGAANGIARGSWFKDNPALVNSLRNAEIFGARISDRFMPMTSFGMVQVLALILIVAMTVVLFITQLQLMQKNMPPEAMTGPMAQQQKMMLYAFPVIFALGGISIPIGVLIYWLTSNVWTMAQQYILIHNNPAPNTPAYVDWEERMRAKGKDPDEITARRLGRNKKANVVATTSRVVRQTRGVPTASASGSEATETVVESPPSAGNGARKPDPRPAPAADESGRQVIARQQPSRQTRAKRKTR